MKLNRNDMILYAVTDRSWLKNGETLCDQVEKALKGGATLVQLREKELDEENFLKEAAQIKKICQKYGVPFIINDNVEIALKVDADGVHVGQEDMEAEDVRAKLGNDKIIGVSAHNVEEALRAQAMGADYLGSGACFHTGSKGNVSALDHEELEKICRTVDIPVVAIGGINKNNILKLSGRGVSGVAVISAIFDSDDIEKETKELKRITEELLNKDKENKGK